MTSLLPLGGLCFCLPSKNDVPIAARRTGFFLSYLLQETLALPLEELGFCATTKKRHTYCHLEDWVFFRLLSFLFNLVLSPTRDVPIAARRTGFFFLPPTRDVPIAANWTGFFSYLQEETSLLTQVGLGFFCLTSKKRLFSWSYFLYEMSLLLLGGLDFCLTSKKRCP
jgi:hypothetical protein